MAKYDDMSFKKAFAAARKEKGAGKTFTWKGKRYTTNYKEEESKAPKKSKRPPKRPDSKSSKTSGPPRRSSRGERPMSTGRIAELTERALERSERSQDARGQAQMVIDQRKALASEGIDVPDDVFVDALNMAFEGNPVSLRRMIGGNAGGPPRRSSRGPQEVTYREWQQMSRAERERRGLPVSTVGWQNQSRSTPRRSSPPMSRGEMRRRSR
jgi:hypothetical protein